MFNTFCFLFRQLTTGYFFCGSFGVLECAAAVCRQFQIGKNIFIFYAANNKTYLSIYGSFSVVLLFFVWIYVSWIIFLYGVKLCAYLEKAGESDKEA